MLHLCAVPPSGNTRAPRLLTENLSRTTRLHVAPATLQGAVVAIISRDTRGVPLSSEQRLTHFPASPLVCLSWFQEMDAGLVEDTNSAPIWRPFGAPLVISGSQTLPNVSWAPSTGRGGMICFNPDVAQSLLGLKLGDIQDRFVSAHEVLDSTWRPLLDAICQADDDRATLEVLTRHLTPRWQQIHGRSSSAPSLSQLGRHWAQTVALKASNWSRTHSPRQVERRVKAFSGRSLREWQSLVKTEGVFFAARQRQEQGLPFDWANLALEEGFSDQAHLSRTAKRITGFSPSEFAQRFVDDESFWLYRLWV